MFTSRHQKTAMQPSATTQLDHYPKIFKTPQFTVSKVRPGCDRLDEVIPSDNHQPHDSPYIFWDLNPEEFDRSSTRGGVAAVSIRVAVKIHKEAGAEASVDCACLGGGVPPSRTPSTPAGHLNFRGSQVCRCAY